MRVLMIYNACWWYRCDDWCIYIYIYCLLQWNVKKNYNSRGLCRVPWTRHSAKFFPKKSRNSLPSAWAGALGKVFFLKKTLPSVWAGALGKVLKKKNFAECLGSGTRQRIFLKIQKFFAECLGWGTRQSNFFKKIKKKFAECLDRGTRQSNF